MPVLNGPQSRAIRCGFLDIDRRMAELEASIAGRAHSPLVFSAMVNDLSATEANVVQEYFARIRTAMPDPSRGLRGCPRYHAEQPSPGCSSAESRSSASPLKS